MAKSGISFGQGVQAGGDIISGISALMSGLENASLLKEQGALTKDDYYKQAELVRDEGHRVRAKQTMEYISSGVEVIGTPQMVLRDTLRQSLKQAGSLETTGINIENMYKKKAKQAKREGYAAFASSILQAGAALV